MSMRYHVENRCVRTVTLAGALVGAFMILAAGVAHSESGAGYSAPPKGLVLSWSRTDKAGGKTVTGSIIHRVLSAGGDEVLYNVSSPGKYDGDEVRLFRGIFSYAFWRPGKGWVEFKFDRAAIAKLWPLKVGNKARVAMRFGYGLGKTVAAAKVRWKVTEIGEIHYRVLRRERVTVPAGTFDTFVIQRTRRFRKFDGKKFFSQRRVGWLAPKLGYIVKQTLQIGPKGPKAKSSVLQLVSVKQPGSGK